MMKKREELTEIPGQEEKEVAMEYIANLSVKISVAGAAMRSKIEIPAWISLVSIMAISYIINVSLHLPDWVTITSSVVMIVILLIYLIQLMVFSEIVSLPERVGELKDSSVKIYNKLKPAAVNESTSKNSTNGFFKLVKRLSLLKDMWSVRDEFQEIILYLGKAAFVINPLFMMLLIATFGVSIILLFICLILGVAVFFV